MSVSNNLIRVGRVSSVDPVTCTVRVAFDDKDDLVSYDLPVIVPQTLKNKDYLIPDVGEQVVCLFLANGLAQGFCLGAIYSEEDTPPVSSPDKRHVSFSDGTSIEYDRSTHTLTIQAVGPINITAAGNVNVIGDVIANGISLTQHVHGGVDPGPGNTGVPK